MKKIQITPPNPRNKGTEAFVGVRAPAEQHKPSLRLLLEPATSILSAPDPAAGRALPSAEPPPRFTKSPNVSFNQLRVTRSNDFLHFFISCTELCGSRHKSLGFFYTIISHTFFFFWLEEMSCSELLLDEPPGNLCFFFQRRPLPTKPTQTLQGELPASPGH